MSVSIKAADLPSNSENLEAWLEKFITSRGYSRSDSGTLSVSFQLIVSELMEEIELLSAEIQSSGIPHIREEVIRAQETKALLHADLARLPMHSSTSSESQLLVKNLARLSDISRARTNISLAKERILGNQ